MTTPDDVLYEQAAQLLADGEAPAIAAFGGDDVGPAFVRAFSGLQPRGDWLAHLKRRVAELSGGATRLFDADREEFTARVKGPAGYLFLVTGGRRHRILLLPGSPPFQIDGSAERCHG